MKKLLIITLVSLTLLTFTGCGNEETKTVKDTVDIVDNAEKGAAEDSTYGVIETAKLFWTIHQDDLSILNNSVTFTCSITGVCQAIVKVESTDSSNNVTITDEIMTLDIYGTKPTGGTIKIDFNSYGIEISELKYGDYKCSKAATQAKVNCEK